MLRKKTVYSLDEFCQYLRMSKVERCIYDFSKELDKKKIDVRKNDKIFKLISISISILLTIEKKINAAPKTGFEGLDNGAWKIVQVIQACLFWVALLYTLKSLLLLTIKGEGEWKKVATGFLICVSDYLVPWLFGMVPGLFNL